MEKYFLVNVEFREISEKGKVTKIKEQFLVKDISCFAAEQVVIKKLVDEGNTLDYTIPSVRETKISQVIE